MDAKRRFEQIRQLPGTDTEGALRDLLDSIDAMEATHADESIHQKRLIAVMVARTGVEPLAAGTDPVSDYQNLLERLNSSLHGQVSLDTVRVLWDNATAVLRRLFLPPDARHEALARLAAIAEPTQDDADDLKLLVASPNHLSFFLARVSGPEWLELLEPIGLLDPQPGQAPWPVLAAVERLADEHAVPLVGFLTRMFEKYMANPDHTRLVAIAARKLGSAGHELLLRAAQKYPAAGPLAWLVEEAALAAEPADPFVQQALDQVINSAMQSGVEVYFSPLLDHYAKGVTADTYGPRIRLLCFKLRRIPESDSHLARYGSITDSPEHGGQDLFPSLLRCLVQALNVAGQFVSVHDLLEAISTLPTAMRDRFRPWILATHVVSDCQLLIDEVSQAIKSRPPTGDDVALVDAAVRNCRPEEFGDRWSDALGDPPLIKDLGAALASGEVPEAWKRAFQWVAILPESTTAHWAGPAAVMSAALGPPPGRASLQLRPTIHGVWGSSPISADDLQAMDPEEAARSISLWRPTPSEPMQSSRELGRALEAVVKAAPSTWGSSPLRMATLLREPVYISHYVRGLAGAASLEGLPVDELINVVMLTTTSPWPPTELGDPTFDYDPNWRGAISDAVDLVAELSRRDVGFAGRDDEVWAFLLAQAEDCTEGTGVFEEDALAQAINRPCTRALQAVFNFMGYEYRVRGIVRPAALELLTRSLELSGEDGLQHRAIIAPRLAFLRYVAADWVDAHRDQLFGDIASDHQLGQQTVDLALRWGQPNRWLLETYPQLVRAAVGRSVDRALDHYMVAMLWGIPGYGVDEVASALRTMDALPEAAMVLGRLLSDDQASTDLAAIAAGFWQWALEHSPTADMLAGFGWFVDMTVLDDATWADLMRRTLTVTHGRIDRARDVAERAGRISPSPDTLETLNQLVRGGGDVWEQAFILDAASAAIIRASHPLIESNEYERLRTALLERGRTIPPADSDEPDDSADPEQ